MISTPFHRNEYNLRSKKGNQNQTWRLTINEEKGGSLSPFVFTLTNNVLMNEKSISNYENFLFEEQL